MKLTRKKINEIKLLPIIKKVLAESSNPKFKKGDIVKYKDATETLEVISVDLSSYEPSYLLKWMDTGKTQREGQSSLVLVKSKK
jgi:hypothetical protein